MCWLAGVAVDNEASQIQLGLGTWQYHATAHSLFFALEFQFSLSIWGNICKIVNAAVFLQGQKIFPVYQADPGGLCFV